MADEEVKTTSVEETSEATAEATPVQDAADGKKIKKNRKSNQTESETKSEAHQYAWKKTKPFFLIFSAAIGFIFIVAIIVSAINISQRKAYDEYFKGQKVSFVLGRQDMGEFELTEMKKMLEPETFDAYYHTEGSAYSQKKEYTGFLLEDVLVAVFGEGWNGENSDQYAYITFHSNNTDDVTYSLEEVRREKTYLTFEVKGATFNISDDTTSNSMKEYGGPFVIILSGIWPKTEAETGVTMENNRVANVYQITVSKASGKK